MRKKFLILFFLFLASFGFSEACSVLYYVNTITGKIYAVNNEDYWYNVNAQIQILPQQKGKQARLWHGWDNFAQGGINAAGLFFDGAVTPEEPKIAGYSKPANNLGDHILAVCKTVNEAVDYLENNKIALTNGHLLFGDKTGNAVVVEWVNGQRNVINIAGNKLLMTNFLLSDTAKGGYPCPRYEDMEAEIDRLEQSGDSIGLKQIGNVLSKAVQPPAKNEKGQEGGTLYSSFIDITDMEFILVYKLDNSKIIRLDLQKEFSKPKKQTIKLN